LAAAVAAAAAKTTTTGTTDGSSSQQGIGTIRRNALSSSSSPYLMCSHQECQDREKWGQVSVWEATAETRHFGSAKHRRMDPSRAVKKYRRSAAGTSHLDSTPRTLTQLGATINHLVHLLATMGKFNDDDNDNGDESVSTSFVDLINFVEDRIRAVQVDLVLLLSPSAATSIHGADETAIIKRQIQYRLIKVQILILYLLSDVSATTTTTTTQVVCYSHKFGHQALATALNNYWGGDNHDHDYSGRQDQQQHYDDEVLSYMAMYELHKDLDQKDCTNDDCCLASNILALYRKHVGKAKRSGSAYYPLFQWTMHVIAICNLGHWHIALRMLYQKGRSQHERTAHDGKNNDEIIMFGNLIRCTLAMMPGSGVSGRNTSPGTLFAGALFKLRRQALRAYNLSFQKQEAVCGQDVARLLVVCIDNCKMNNKNCIHAATTAWGYDDDDDDVNNMDTRLSDSIGENDKKNDIWLDAKRAIRIGQAVNLPINDDQTALVFKAAPITEPMVSSCMQHNIIASGNKMTFNIRDDDAFVLSHVESLRHCHHSSSVPLVVPPESWIQKLLAL
jgi:hypothetical protein